MVFCFKDLYQYWVIFNVKHVSQKKKQKKIKLFSAKVLFSDILNTWTDKSFHLTKKAPIDLLILITSFFYNTCSLTVHETCMFSAGRKMTQTRRKVRNLINTN